MNDAAAEPEQRETVRAIPRGLLWALFGLLVLRLLYHAGYLQNNPFALITFSDGQLYEEAARDLLQHPPLGQAPFYLQGLYALLLALGMAPLGVPLGGLLLQLLVALLALWLFLAAAVRSFGARAGALSALVLLAQPALSFYENKYLSVSLGVSMNVLCLWAFARVVEKPYWSRMVLLGGCAGLSLLGRPNMLLALPFIYLAVARSCPLQMPRRAVLSGLLLGLALSLSPMALRNAVVTGRPAVLPSHGGGIPFYIGNNPHANGRWNTAGGLLSGQVARERVELAQRLGLALQPGDDVDAALGAELRGRALDYIASQPGAWLALTGRKLALTLGDREYARDYDRLGEREIMGMTPHGLSFGIVLGLGLLGFACLAPRALRGDGGRAPAPAWRWFLVGQLLAIGAANLLVFTSAQNRLPLVIPLSFVAGPALMSLWERLRRVPEGTPVAWGWLLAALLLAGQAFVPRDPPQLRPSSAHHYNLAVVWEELKRPKQAAQSFGRAAAQNPRQPLFALRHAHALLNLGRLQAARTALDGLQKLRPLPPAVAAAAARERTRLQAMERTR